MDRQYRNYLAASYMYSAVKTMSEECSLPGEEVVVQNEACLCCRSTVSICNTSNERLLALWCHAMAVLVCNVLLFKREKDKFMLNICFMTEFKSFDSNFWVTYKSQGLGTLQFVLVELYNKEQRCLEEIPMLIKECQNSIEWYDVNILKLTAAKHGIG